MKRWRYEARAEPIPGHQLLEPLAASATSEVWKCLAPGGVLKVLKFRIRPDSLGEPASGREEAEPEGAWGFRHPGLLSTGPVAILGDELAIVMELADFSLEELRQKYRALARVGIPRDELLGYVAEAADALDAIHLRHGVCHLDVRPRNLFVVGERLKLGDRGRAEGSKTGHARDHYTAPEVIEAVPVAASDQYALAVTYFDLLTGIEPVATYEGKDRSSRDHPWEALAESDRALIRRALAERPEDRFPSCAAFVAALWQGGLVQPSSHVWMSAPTGDAWQDAGSKQSGGSALGRPLLAEPRLPSAGAARPTDAFIPFPLAELLAELAVLRRGEQEVRVAASRLARPACLTERFGTRLTPALAAARLDALCQEWDAVRLQAAHDWQRFRFPLEPSFWQRCCRQEPWLEVQVMLSVPGASQATLAEVVVELHLRDVSPHQERYVVEELGPRLLANVRECLQAHPERRRHERLRCERPLHVAMLGEAIHPAAELRGWGKDVSPRGVGIYLPQAPAFQSLAIRLAISGEVWTAAFPARVVRIQACGGGWHEIGCHFLLEGWHANPLEDLAGGLN